MNTEANAIDAWLEGEESRQREKILSKVTEVCAVPATAQRVMTLSMSDKSDMKQLSDAVTADAAITAQLLRIANSPIYAHSRQIKDVSRAIVMIGRRELASISSAMAMMAAVQSNTELSNKLNQTSVLCATLARMIAESVNPQLEPPTAFLAGLLCEIGALACLAVDGDEYQNLHQQSAGSFEKLAELELQRYCLRSEEIGAHMLKRNMIPEDVTEAVATTLETDLSEATSLQRITIFCRHAAPTIVAAAKAEDTVAMVRDVTDLLERFGVGAVESDSLLDICISSAAAAELRLRGRPVD